jgi:hypothetical protein
VPLSCLSFALQPYYGLTNEQVVQYIKGGSTGKLMQYKYGALIAVFSEIFT